jgi:NADPH:quinone reductase
MRAAFVKEPGPPESIRIGELPKPRLGRGDLLVRVGSVSFNPIDLYIRAGTVTMPLSYPYIVGCDFAGRVEDVGPGVARFKVGDRVWGSNQGLLGRQGTAAEYAAVSEEFAYPTPDVISDNEAAAMALVGITAHLGLFGRARLEAEETVYVPGGAGGVGSMVVQMAKAAGAKVATSAGNANRVQICKDLGADLALDYKTDDVASELRGFAPDGVDVWFETQREPNLEVSIPLLRRRGRMVLMAGRTALPTLPLGSFYTRDCSLFGFAMFNASPTEQRVCGSAIGTWAKEGKLKPLVGAVFTLEEAAQAQRLLEDNTLKHAGTLFGKVVVEV